MPRGSATHASWHVKGIRSRYPALHEWLKKRMGTRDGCVLVASFAAFEALRFVVSEFGYSRTVNPHSINFVATGISLIIAIVSSFVLEGTQAFGKVFSWHPLWRFLGVASLFAAASALSLVAQQMGATSASVVTVGYIYMPISAILSYFVFNRLYGRLEWLAMGMLTLAILTFVFLREQSKGQTIVDIVKIRSQYSIPGLLLIVCSVVASVLGSILAERIFKDRSKGLKWWSARFYVMKVHLDSGQFLITGLLWALPMLLPFLPNFITDGDPHFAQEWFGQWTWRQYLLVFVLVGQSWLAGLLVKEFSTVVRALTQSVTLILVMCVEDPIMGNRYHFVAREVPTVILTIIIFLSAMIFQTGRINVQDIRKAATFALSSASSMSSNESSMTSNESLGGPETQEQRPSAGARGARQERSKTPSESASSFSGQSSGTDAGLLQIAQRQLVKQKTSSGEPPEVEKCSQRIAEQQSCRRKVVAYTEQRSEGQAQSSSGWKTKSTIKVLMTTYALIMVYTFSDATRNLVLQRAMASTRINANSMGLMQYLCGVAAASCLTLFTHGWAGIKEALQVRKIIKCFPAGFLFAVQATLMNMAYSRGISAALALILGRVYIPVAAVGARCVLGKFYMWLEYAAICILTLATVVFGYLKAFSITAADPEEDSSIMLAGVLVMASATTAAFNSLLTERILKDEPAPFHLQKIRLDMASTVSCLVLIPIVGAITMRVQDIPWVNRPVSTSCSNPVCWDLDQGSCGNPACDCDCAEGLFAGWTRESMPVILLALAIGIAYNWLVGKLVQRFSTVHRCIADSFSLLMIYFIGDPMLNHTRLDDMCLNLTAFIVPLSSALFAVSAAEMQWAMEAVAILRDGRRSGSFRKGTASSLASAPVGDDDGGDDEDHVDDGDGEGGRAGGCGGSAEGGVIRSGVEEHIEEYIDEDDDDDEDDDVDVDEEALHFPDHREEPAPSASGRSTQPGSPALRGGVTVDWGCFVLNL